MEMEVKPEPSDEERAALVEALRAVLDGRAEDPRGPWGRASLESDEEGSLERI